MKSTEKIIGLIQKGDPIPILAEDSLVEIFNELLKFNLIDIIEDRVVLTSKGEEAKNIGLEKVVNELKIREELKEFSVDIQRQESKLFQVCFGLSLTLIAMLVAASFTNWTLIF